MNTDLECEECGRTFLNTAGLFTHQKKSCRPGKRSLKDLLSDARGYWKTVSKEASSSQKRRRLGSPQGSNARPVQRSPAPGSVVPISNTGLDEETSVLNLPVAVVGSQDSINQPHCADFLNYNGKSSRHGANAYLELFD
ncbi:hypothetical protein BKA70DRAFT_1226591 [Coprinopsis sp. MPI-PUGE-AT-0042]|nr:hypothetical protein BKA70DRAFT_1226591 [Coprinopsis sp. MPI-PUGE-AT-0042]